MCYIVILGKRWDAVSPVSEHWLLGILLIETFCFKGRRKSAEAEAVVYAHGSGRVSVNGTDYLLYFPVTQDRLGFAFGCLFLKKIYFMIHYDQLRLVIF